MGIVLLSQYALPVVRALADDDVPPTVRSEVLGSAFTYQGRIEQGGVPVDGALDLEFALYDASEGGGVVGTLPVLEDVAVANGLFSVQLEFGAAAFAGDERWIEVRSRPGASTGLFVTNGRQLTATPYALYAKSAGSAASASTAQAAPWSGLTGVPLGFADEIDNSFTLPYIGTMDSASALVSISNTNAGGSMVNIGLPLTGLTSLSPGDAIVGESLSGLTGVYGKSLSVDFPAIAYGVRGDGEAVGVYGLGIGGGSSGVYGEGLSYGVQGKGLTFGVFGKATSVTGTGILGEGTLYGVDGSGSTGVRGQSTVMGGYGVRGESLGDGVYGQTATAGKSGIVGVASGGAGTDYAGFFLGNVNVDGDLSAVNVNGLSDARLKRDVAPSTRGLAAVLALKPVSFAWIDRPDTSSHLGFIAQDVREVLPEAVNQADDEMGTLSIRTLELIPVLVRAIQELEARLTELEAVCLP